jgi:hypothetical protein
MPLKCRRLQVNWLCNDYRISSSPCCSCRYSCAGRIAALLTDGDTGWHIWTGEPVLASRRHLGRPQHLPLRFYPSVSPRLIMNTVLSSITSGSPASRNR